MKGVVIGIAIGFTGLLLGSARLPARAEELRNPNIEIAYVEPSNPEFEGYYKGLQARKVLEELRAFLAPLKLPRTIVIKVDQCGNPVEIHQPGGPVTICYEYVAQLQQLAKQIPTDGSGPHGVTRDDAVVGAFIQAALQQTASAVFDTFNTPIWGREQDAADRLAAFLMLQFGPQAARKLMTGAAYFFEASDHTWTGVDFSDVRGTESQRYYNYLCIAYGYDPLLFGDFYKNETGSGSVAYKVTLPPTRVFWCPYEYQQIKWAFDTQILPYVDPDLLQKVLARDWLKPYVD